MTLYSDWLQGLTSDSTVPLGGTGRHKPRRNGEQNYLLDPEQVTVPRAVSAMKGRTKNESTALAAIHQQETAALPANVAGALPSFAPLHTTLYCRRQERYPLLPNSRAESDIPNSFEQQAQESGSSRGHRPREQSSCIC